MPTPLNEETLSFFEKIQKETTAVEPVNSGLITNPDKEDFNYWNNDRHKLNVRWDESGIWEGFIPHVGNGSVYKYFIESSIEGVITEKADPYARRNEHPPKVMCLIQGVTSFMGCTFDLV